MILFDDLKPLTILETVHIDGLMKKRRNSIANALELRIFCIKPSI